jgi:chemotaxis receptor (MCP) glutamine deamidase CheD
MQTQVAQTIQRIPKEIQVGRNECRLAKHSERLVARDILADVVLTIQVPVAGFAAMLRFSPPEERGVPRKQIEALWDFADQAIDLLFQNIRSMSISTDEIIVSAIGGADLAGTRGKQLALSVRRSLWSHGVVLTGKDLGGAQRRLVWLESATGRLIVRSTSTKSPAVDEKQAYQEVHQHKAS